MRWWVRFWHLLKANELPHVQVRVLPLSAGLHRAVVAGPAEISDYQELWGALEAASLSKAESVEFISRKLKELNDRES